MSRDMPRRVPVTERAWLRFFSELDDAASGSEDLEALLAVAENRISSLSALLNAMQVRWRKIMARVQAVEQAPQPNDRLSRVALRRIREMRFLDDYGWR